MKGMPLYMINPIYVNDSRVFIIDQTKLPERLEEMEIANVEEMYEAIRSLRVRGAPAIGIACAFGVYLGIKNVALTDTTSFRLAVATACERLCGARPTAVNLFWAAERMKAFADKYYFTNVRNASKALLNEALAIMDEETRSSRSIGLYGAELLENHRGILTHCNAGALAAPGFGTATAPLYIMQERGSKLDVYVDETRPLLQGARLTAWELAKEGLSVTVITDSMAGVILRHGWVDAVIVGADRIARNGDTANKVGTYALSVLAKAHDVPFYVAAPFSTVDFETENGSSIPIEQRSPDEIRYLRGVQIVPDDVRIFNPSFDVTPASNITAFITDRGVAHSPEELRTLSDFGRLLS